MKRRRERWEGRRAGRGRMREIREDGRGRKKEIDEAARGRRRASCEGREEEGEWGELELERHQGGEESLRGANGAARGSGNTRLRQQRRREEGRQQGREPRRRVEFRLMVRERRWEEERCRVWEQRC